MSGVPMLPLDRKEKAEILAAETQAADEDRLAQLGYKQELKRGLNAFTNFAISFSVVSFLSGITGSFGNAWFYGGPVSVVWGWILVSFMVTFVALAMSEICSSFPTSGGLYYWAARLGGKHAVFASWVTGWFNLLGQVGVTAGTAMACTNSIVMATSPSQLNRHAGLALASITAGITTRPEPCPVDNMGNLVTSLPALDMLGHSHTTTVYSLAECSKLPFNPSQPKIYGIFVGVMALVGLINCTSLKWLYYVVVLSAIWHMAGSLVVTFGLPGAAETRLTAEMIWTRFQPSNWNALYGAAGKSIYYGYSANAAINHGGNGISATDHAHAYAGAFLASDSSAFVHSDNLHLSGKYQTTSLSPAFPYIFLCGMLMSQWTYTGYDASAHMSEETRNASIAGPVGIMMTIAATFVFGLAYIIGIVSSIPDYWNTLNGPLAVNYNPAAAIMWDVLEVRTGDGRYACGFWIIPMFAQFLCATCSMTSNSRMLYAFSRDDAVPGSSFWHHINERVGIPVNAVGVTVACLLLALPVVQSVTAFTAVTSIATIGLYISYAVPIWCRLTVGRANFVPGPFFLGQKLSLFVHAVAICWVILICVIFVLPTTYPLSMKLNFNYAIVAVGVVLVYSVGTWFLPGPHPFNAKRWFTGPNIGGLEFQKEVDGGPGASMHPPDEHLHIQHLRVVV